MAIRPSPPGRFSTITGWPQRWVRRSANTRAPISVPLPGPSVTMNLTVRVGQSAAADGVAATSKTAMAPTMIADGARRCMICSPSRVCGRPIADGAREVSALQPRRHVFILALELHAGGERHGFGQRREILLQIFLWVLLQHGGAEMALQHFARR